MTNRAFAVDWLLLLPVLVLVILSLSTLWSIDFGLFKNQLFFLFVSSVVFFFFSQVHNKFLEAYALIIYIAALVIFSIVLVVGVESHGAVRWVDIGGVRIQFSEIFKPFLALALASFLAKQGRSSFAFFATLGLLLPIVGFIYLQPDLGNALIYVSVVMLTLFTAGFPIRYFFVCLGGVVLTSPLFWIFLHDYQRQRIFTFLHPSKDPLGTSYNAVQSVVAVGSGMFLGKGLSQGTQSGLRFLPERHTDFIFATLSEDLGFVGSVLVVLCFAFLLFRIYQIFSQSRDQANKLFLTLGFFLLLVQFFMNIGMNIGLLPIVGITLPFVSYGGSSLLSNCILLGLISAMSTAEAKGHQTLEIR